MHVNKSALALLFFIIAACSPKVKTNIVNQLPMLAYNETVKVIGITEAVPDSAIEIGTVNILDNGFSANCGFDEVTEKAKMEARKVGGNLVKLIEHKLPNAMESSCHRIKARIYKLDGNKDSLILAAQKKTIIDSTWNYAKLYFYRPSGLGPLIGYDIYLGDSVICRMKNKSRKVIKISKKGLNTLWAKTEAKVEIPIDIEFGKVYFIKCGLGMGLMVGRPQMNMVDRSIGKEEYNSINVE